MPALLIPLVSKKFIIDLTAAATIAIVSATATHFTNSLLNRKSIQA